MVGCFEPPDLPDAPRITQVNGVFYDAFIDDFGGARVDSVNISFDFQDGDGNLGNLPGDQTTTNYVIQTFKRNGSTVDSVKFSDGQNFGGFFALEDEPIDGAISGTLEYGFTIILGADVTFLDTLLFDIYIIDRAGNESNIVRTPEIVIEAE